MSEVGESLYEMWALEMERQGTGLDAWADIEDTDKNAWGRIHVKLIAQGWKPKAERK